jgi:hypothetical protein
MPLLKTIPGECPAHVLIPTTRGRLRRPEPVEPDAVTPVDPLPRSGSGGALFSASKSPRVSPVFPATGAGSDFSAPAHLRIAPPFAFQST